MTFSSDWLKLREPADLRARNRILVAHVAAAFAGKVPINVVDLGAGAGATVKALAPHLPEDARWRLVDNDAALLSLASWTLPQERLEARCLDLDRALEQAIEAPADLVTCSALLDLVSESWLERLIGELGARGVPFYAALTYDGSTTLTPGDPLDEPITEALNQHQHRDKGFGPALGPDAALLVPEKLKAAGFSVEVGRSDWLIDDKEPELANALLTGWVDAVAETGLIAPPDLGAWRKARLDAVAAGELTLRVGHIDLFARPN
ncbi:methyltransferase domain-containing protein [Amorphus sp. 3PC139-8]|uniref:methyltransferase domain-containing protein n=1 Tax=Amorphus sp. 3PC139-8 TaxID=2735676 RepID=UPI00345DA68D